MSEDRFDPETGEISLPAPIAPAPALVPMASINCMQVCTALAAASGEFATPRRTAQVTVKLNTGGSYTFKYAPLEEILSAVRPALSVNGLAVQQYLVHRSGQTVLRTIIWHASGEFIASDYPIFPTKEGPQGFASGVTYARRYGLSLALCLAPEDDDDGNAAEGNTVTPLERPQQAPRAEPRRARQQREDAPPPPAPPPAPSRAPEPAPAPAEAPPEVPVDKVALRRAFADFREALTAANPSQADAIIESDDFREWCVAMKTAFPSNAETNIAALKSLRHTAPSTYEL
jgi:ERF superfamily